ncbi:hypothetical protein BsBEST3102_41860 [Bacillus subtilis]|nr:hypothetical protein NBRC13719_41890 [Bacillus subtilis subsp. subtilis]BCV81626.1 hypothetical protein BsBEST3102_41860 [Bacillus subtilis]BCV85858.1 hypothetical protein BsBEST3106_41860 [Bacillus subtilis]BCV90091.1 hypothetical protein BsBEST3109_41870 [Bacillus subtilis]
MNIAKSLKGSQYPLGSNNLTPKYKLSKIIYTIKIANATELNRSYVSLNIIPTDK